jgi:hypothetical protein
MLCSNFHFSLVWFVLETAVFTKSPYRTLLEGSLIAPTSLHAACLMIILILTPHLLTGSTPHLFF